jgi:hypothetical protein
MSVTKIEADTDIKNDQQQWEVKFRDFTQENTKTIKQRISVAVLYIKANNPTPFKRCH